MSLSFVFRETKIGIKNNLKMALTSILIMSFSLFFFLFFVILTINSFDILYKRIFNLRMEVYPIEGLKKEYILFLEDIIENLRGVAEVEFIDKDKAREAFLIEYPEYKELVDIFEESFFPPKWSIKIEPYALFLFSIDEIKSFILRLPGIKEVYFGEEFLVKIFKVLLFLIFIDIFFFFFLLFLLSLTILQTLRLTIKTRLPLIEILYLIGADEEYVRSPFALEGALYGFFGALISVFLLYFFLFFIRKFFGVSFSYFYYVALSGLFLGILLGFLSSQMALSDIERV
jgi:cell division transport system permease protein